jgi:hypothetical protein
MFGTIYPVMQCHIPDDMHGHEALNSRLTLEVYVREGTVIYLATDFVFWIQQPSSHKAFERCHLHTNDAKGLEFSLT